MNKKLLSITVITAITFSSATFAAQEDPKIKSAGCAAGKCGGVKKFEEVNTASNPQDKLVYARDGKCGVSGHSIRAEKEGKCSSGVCGNAE